MPTHNGARFLIETLESLDRQTYPISELIISDDNSSDNTLELVGDFANRAGFKVLVVEHVPDGVTANYLNALRYTSGDIVCVADQDDVWLSNKAELVVQAFENENVSLVCHDCLLVDAELKSLERTLRVDARQSLLLGQSINCASDLNNLRRFLKGGLPLLAHSLAFKNELKSLLLNKPTAIDIWWFEEWLSCIALTQGRLHFITDHLVLYRQHESQTSGGFGQPPKFSTKPAARPDETASKYASRIEKMRFCALIALDDALVNRHQVFERYGQFLQQRDGLLERPLAIRPLLSAVALLFRGHYHLYANGLKSFGLDFVTQIRSLKKGSF